MNEENLYEGSNENYEAQNQNLNEMRENISDGAHNYSYGTGQFYYQQPVYEYKPHDTLQDHPRYSYTRPPVKKKLFSAKSLIAVVLACSIIFTSLGFGGALWISRFI